MDTERIRKIKEKYEKELEKKGCHGIDVGLKIKDGKITDEVSIRCYVLKKKALSTLSKKEIIPSSLNGVVTDIIQSDEIEIQIVKSENELEHEKSRKSKWRPIRPGISVGNLLVTAGSIGAMVIHEGKRAMISNCHVLSPHWNGAKIGDPIIQQGRIDGGNVAMNEVGKLVAFKEIDFAGKDNKVDGAVSDLIREGIMSPDIVGLGVPRGEVEPVLGAIVCKSGRTTRCTEGVITGIHATVSVSYGSGKVAKFVDQVVTNSMSAGGDSGSILITKDSKKVVGLLFAGSSSLTIYNRWTDVKEALNCELYTEEEEEGNTFKIDIEMEPEENNEEKTWTLFGKIINKETKEPIEAVKITLRRSDKEYFPHESDGNGDWSLLDVLEGDYVIKFEKEGFKLVKVEFTLPPSSLDISEFPLATRLWYDVCYYSDI